MRIKPATFPRRILHFFRQPDLAARVSRPFLTIETFSWRTTSKSRPFISSAKCLFSSYSDISNMKIHATKRPDLKLLISSLLRRKRPFAGRTDTGAPSFLSCVEMTRDGRNKVAHSRQIEYPTVSTAIGSYGRFAIIAKTKRRDETFNPQAVKRLAKPENYFLWGW